MNWIKYQLSQGEFQKLESTAVGKRISDLLSSGRDVLERGTYLKTITAAIFIGIIAAGITYIFPSIREYCGGVGIICFLVSFGMLLGSRYFEERNSKSERFQKIQEELDDLLYENPKEREILEKIVKIDSM